MIFCTSAGMCQLHTETPALLCVPALSHWQRFVCDTSAAQSVTLVVCAAVPLCCMSCWHRVLPDLGVLAGGCERWWQYKDAKGEISCFQTQKPALCYVTVFSSLSSLDVTLPCAHPRQLDAWRTFEIWLGQHSILGTVGAITSHLFAEDRCCF